MDVLIPLALLAVGLIIGFFAARHIYTQPKTQQAVAQAERALKEVLAQQAEQHIYQTRQSVNAIESQCSAIKQQIDEYESLLSQSADDDKPALKFFGDQASSYLRNNISSKESSSAPSVSNTQPRDFANAGSGLFVGGSKQSTADKSSQ